jgi:hypothetical protein
MCYNKDISIYTYILGLVSSYFLIINDKPSLKILGWFFMIAIQMQLVEYFLWTNNKCNIKNITISNIGAFINFIEPIVLYLAILYFNKNIKKENRKNINIVIFVYIIALFIFTMRILPIGCSTMNEFSAPYLQWSWMYEKDPSYIFSYFPIAIMLLLYFGLDKPYNIYLSLICMISFIASYIIYRKQRAFGNIWCWISVFIPMIVLIYDRYLLNI